MYENSDFSTSLLNTYHYLTFFDFSHTCSSEVVSHCRISFKAWLLFIYLLAVWVFVAAPGLFSSFGELGLLSGCTAAQACLCSGISCSRARALGLMGFSSGSSWALEHRLNCCGAEAWLLCDLWDLLGPGIEPMSPAMAGRFITTEPPGKSLIAVLNYIFWCFMMLCIFSWAYYSLIYLWRNVC